MTVAAKPRIDCRTSGEAHAQFLTGQCWAQQQKGAVRTERQNCGDGGHCQEKNMQGAETQGKKVEDKKQGNKSTVVV